MSIRDTITNGRFIGDSVLMASPFVPNGGLVLLNQNKIVYIGKVGDPIEDAVFDWAVLSEKDYKDFIISIDKLEK